MSRGDTPSAEPQKGTAKITGINWDYFAGDGFEILDSSSEPVIIDTVEIKEDVDGSELVHYENVYGPDAVSYMFNITTTEKKHQIENTLKKLIVPYEIVKNGKSYTVTSVEFNESIKYDLVAWRGAIPDEDDIAEGKLYIPILASDESYLLLEPTAENTTYLIIPACVQRANIKFPRDYILYAEGSPLNN